ncbi:MAG: nuclear transport factor 2 family protein [Dehalococcoidia bacterium]|nr:nuclear transport factor 2 family protein [Dehalococcoidia bacterium]
MSEGVEDAARTLHVARLFSAAVASGDTADLEAATSREVAIEGPRGTAYGVEVLRGWVAGSGIRLRPDRAFAGQHAVVVEADAEWVSEQGAVTGRSRTAIVLGIRDGLLARIARFDEDLPAALQAAGLTEADEARATWD